MTLLYPFRQPKTIYECVAFFCILQFLSSCNGLWKQNGHFVCNKWTHLYSIIGAINVVSCLGYAVYIILSDELISEHIYRQDKLLLSIAALEIIMSTCTYIITSFAMQHQAQHHLQLYDRIHRLDQQLLRDFDGVNFNYYKLTRKNMIESTLLTVVYVMAVYSILAQIAHGNLWVLWLGTWFYTVVTCGPHLCCYVHMNFSEVLRIRFRLLQKILNNEYMCAKFPSYELRQQRVEEVIEIVKEYHGIIRDVNEVYKLTLMAALAHDYTLTTCELYMIFGHSINSQPSYVMLGYVAMHIFPPIYKMLIGPILCDMAIKEGKTCLRLIEQTDNWFPKNPHMNCLVSSVMYWRMENKIEFTCGLNVVYNSAIIATVTAVVFNYLLILIQFRMTQLMGIQIEEQKNILQDWIGDI